MTIFDLKPIEINKTTTTSFCKKVNSSQWYFDLESSNDEYKYEKHTLRRRPSNKKVTFADENGRLLVKVFIIDRNDFPPLSSLLQLENCKITSKSENTPIKKVIQPHDWVTSFIQPASVYSRFKTQLIKQNVKLATAIILKNTLSESQYEYHIVGVVKVVNLCFQKRIFIRLSSDERWTSSKDHEALYKASSHEYIPETNVKCNIDEFEFRIQLPTTPEDITSYLEFAVGMETPEGSYWDSNCDKNYRLDYYQVVTDNGSGIALNTKEPISVPGPYTLDYKPNFDQFRNDYTQYRAWSHFSDGMSFY